MAKCPNMEMEGESHSAHYSLAVGATPCLHQLKQGFQPGTFVTFKGTVHDDAKKFAVNLMLDEDGRNIALHLNPRLNQNEIVLNTRKNGVWGCEEKCHLHAIARGKEVQLTILCDHWDMKVSINDRLAYRFSHRVTPSDITHLEVVEDLKITEILYNYRGMKVESHSANYSLAEGATPCVRQLDRGFRPGTFVTVKGTVHDDAKRFAVNLMLGEDGRNKALHLNPRLNQNEIVLNTRKNGVWGCEEKCHLHAIARGKEVQLTILCDHWDMKVSINDRHAHRFSHRLTPSITHLAVDGDFKITEILYNYGGEERRI